MSQEVKGPQFITMLRWYLAGDAAAVARWVIQYHEKTGKKLTRKECEEYVNYLMTDIEMKVVDHARENKVNVKEFIEQLQKDLEVLGESK